MADTDPDRGDFLARPVHQPRRQEPKPLDADQLEMVKAGNRRHQALARALYSPEQLESLKAIGVNRMGDNPQAILVHFNREPTDDELRALHDALGTPLPDPGGAG